MIPKIEKRPLLPHLLLLTLLGLLIRLPNLGRDSLWFDEAISYLAAQLTVGDIFSNALQSSHPPLYYFFLGVWMQLVPDSDVALRSLSVLWNLLLIPLIGYFAFDLFGKKHLALLVALMVAISPFHLLYSHELRMYTQLMFLVTAGAWVYWRILQRSAAWLWLLFGLVWLTAVYTHFFAILALGAINLHALLDPERRTIFPRVFLISVGLGVLFLPWVFVILGEGIADGGSLRPLNKTVVRDPIKLLTSPAFLLFGSSNSFLFSSVVLFICLGVVVVLAIEWRHVQREGVPSGVRLILCQIGLVLGVPLGVYLIRPFWLPERTMAAASPFLLLLLAWCITRKRTPLPYLAGLSVGLMIVASLLYQMGTPLKPPYSDAMSLMLAQHQPSDTVLHTSDGSYLPALRYANISNHFLLANDPDARKQPLIYEAMGGQLVGEEVVGVNDRLWIIVALEHSVEWQQEKTAYFLAERTLIERREVGGIVIYLFE